MNYVLLEKKDNKKREQLNALFGSLLVIYNSKETIPPPFPKDQEFWTSGVGFVLLVLNL
jgi:hypothetical protein